MFSVSFKIAKTRIALVIFAKKWFLKSFLFKMLSSKCTPKIHSYDLLQNAGNSSLPLFRCDKENLGLLKLLLLFFFLLCWLEASLLASAMKSVMDSVTISQVFL